jgi:hypothetical protein
VLFSSILNESAKEPGIVAPQQEGRLMAPAYPVTIAILYQPPGSCDLQEMPGLEDRRYLSRVRCS